MEPFQYLLDSRGKLREEFPRRSVAVFRYERKIIEYNARIREEIGASHVFFIARLRD
jgi:hypothetical protein